MKNLKSILLAVFAALMVIAPAHLALADPGGQKGHTFDSTFTKWGSSAIKTQSASRALQSGDTPWNG